MFGEIRNADGEKLDYTFHAGDSDSKAIVLLGHGVTGNKDRPFVVALAEHLADHGLHALRFSFSGNGDSEGRFEDSTITKEVADLGAVLDAVGDRPVVYIGHSMGGAVGVIRASQDERIRCLVSLAGMVHPKAFYEREFASETPGQGCMWEEPSCPLSQAYHDDMMQLDTLAPLGAKIQVPWLIVHGQEDDVVPIQDSHDIIALADPKPDFIVLNQANHVFAEPHTAPMCQAVVAWISQRV